MKKESTSRRKKLPLLLGALLIISVAAYGTRAYFSDSADMQGNIKLTLGDVEISTSDTENWKYKPLEITTNPELNKNKNLSNLGADGSITDAKNIENVRPGDSFTRKYIIKNTGSLDVKVGLEYSGKYKQFVDTSKPIDKVNIPGTPFLISLGGLNKDLILKANDNENSRKEYNITITVDPNANNDLYNANTKRPELDDLVGDFINEIFTVKAIQTNTTSTTSTAEVN